MVPFVGREKELKALEDSEGKGKAVLVYGRRRIGKTTLLKKFCEDKHHLYLTVLEGAYSLILEDFHRSITEFRGIDSGPYISFRDFIDDLKRVCTDRNTIIVIDEYQYLIETKMSINSYIQQFVDGFLSETESTLILNGSKISVMRMLAEDAKDPLFGRFKRIIPLGPLTYTQCKTFHPGMSEHDQMMFYLTFGGIPRYHVEMDQMTYRDTIRSNCIESQWVTDEVMFLLKSDYENSRDCAIILGTIANGTTRLKEIMESTGFGTRCVELLERMKAGGLVDIINPMLDAPKKSRIYYIRDEIMAFHFIFLRRNGLALNGSDPAKVYDRLYPDIMTHLGIRFEYFCKDMLVQTYMMKEIGRWWMDNTKLQIHEDIDIVARMVCDRTVYDLFIECKFTSKTVGFGQFNDLDRRVSRFEKRCNPLLMMISESGFDEEFREYANMKGILLVGPEELHGNRPMPQPEV